MLVRLAHLLEITVCSSVVARLVSRGIVFPSSDSTLDALVVEVGVVLLLESGQDLLELLDTLIVRVPLASDTDDRLPELIHPLLGQTDQDAHLASFRADIALDHSALLSPLDVRVFCFQLLKLVLLAFDLGRQSLDAVLDFFPQPSSLDHKLFPLLRGIAQALLSDLVQPPPLLANFLALVCALHTTNMLKLFASVTAELIVADAVVDARERHVCRQVALVLAVEARERESGVDRVSDGIGRCLRRDRREVCTG